MAKILYTNFHPGNGGGHTTYLLALLKGHPEKFEVAVACPAKSELYKKAQSEGFKTYGISFPGKIKELRDIYDSLVKLRSIIKQGSFTHIHVNGSPDHRLVMYALLTTRLSSRPKIVFTKHNNLTVKKNIFSQIRYKYFSDQIITVCNYLRYEFQSFGISANRIHHVANGVNTRHFAGPLSLAQKKALRESLNLPKEKIILVSCAGTALHKGWQFLIKAINQITDPKYAVVVLGPPPSNKKILDLELETSQVFFPGQINDIRPYLLASDIGFVLSTSIETVSFACREMMSSGLPCLVSDTGCLPENISKDTGWVTRAGNHKDIINVLHAISSSDLYHMGENARKRALKYFDQEEFLTGTFKVYDL